MRFKTILLLIVLSTIFIGCSEGSKTDEETKQQDSVTKVKENDGNNEGLEKESQVSLDTSRLNSIAEVPKKHLVSFNKFQVPTLGKV